MESGHARSLSLNQSPFELSFPSPPPDCLTSSLHSQVSCDVSVECSTSRAAELIQANIQEFFTSAYSLESVVYTGYAFILRGSDQFTMLTAREALAAEVSAREPESVWVHTEVPPQSTMYPSFVSRALSWAQDSGRRLLNYTLGGRQFTVSLTEPYTQTDETSRVTEIVHKVLRTWEFEEGGNFTPFNLRDSLLIEKAYLERASEICLRSSPNEEFHVNLKELKQTVKSSGLVRNVRRAGFFLSGLNV